MIVRATNWSIKFLGHLRELEKMQLQFVRLWFGAKYSVIINDSGSVRSDLSLSEAEEQKLVFLTNRLQFRAAVFAS